MKDDFVLDPEVRTRIVAVSNAWNEMLITGGRDELTRQNAGEKDYRNPIVTALNPDNGAMLEFAKKLDDLFELMWSE